jgi:hypothetical protein
LVDKSAPLRCPVCHQEVPCISRAVSLYCLALHIAAKWDDEDHLTWRQEHGITLVVYQSIGQVYGMVQEIMTALASRLPRTRAETQFSDMNIK